MENRGGGVPINGPTQIVFVRLDPILKRLLPLVTKLKSIYDDDSDESKEEQHQQQLLISLLKEIIKLLDDLTDVIASFGRIDQQQTTVTQEEQQQSRTRSVFFGPSLALLADYVSLPLTAIFHIKIPTSPQILQDGTAGGDRDSAAADGIRRNQVLTAHIQSLYISAAQAIRVYVEVCSSTAAAGQQPTTLLKKQHLNKFIIAMTNRLPTSSAATSQRYDEREVQQRGKDTTSLTDPSLMPSTLLQSVNVILPFCDGTDLLEIWQGGLLMRLADCTSFLTTYQVDDENGDGKTNDSNSKKDGAQKSNSPSATTAFKQVHLQSLETLNLMLQITSTSSPSSTTSTNFWRSIFPGIFLPVYRTIMNSSRVTATGLVVSIEEKAFTVLNGLLQSSLIENTTPLNVGNRNFEQNKKEADNNIPTTTRTMAASSNPTDRNKDLLQKITSMVNSQNSKTSRDYQQDQLKQESNEEQCIDQGDHTDSAFEKKVRERVVPPLNVVIRQQSMSRSISIRRLVVALCRILLLDTRPVWKGTSLEKTPLEICMMLKQDTAVDVSRRATSTIQEYVKTMEFGDISFMVSTVLELIEKLPALVEGGRQIEIRMQFQLLTGYLSSMGNKGASAMATSDILKRCLIHIADVDLGSVEKVQVASLVDEVAEGSVIESRFFDFDLSCLFHNFLVTLGRSLGVKYGALVVDSILVDLIMAGQSRPTRPEALSRWMHQWIGSLVVARSLVKGAFSSSKNGGENKSKKTQQRERIMESFASSIFPLLLRSQLWDVSLPHQAHRCDQDGIRPRINPQVLQSNVCGVVLILEFFRDFCICLKSLIGNFLPTVLYPVTEKASLNNISSVHATALQTLQALSAAENKESVDDIVAEHQRILCSAMLGQLRISNGSQVPQQADKERIVNVSRSALWTLHNISTSTMEKSKMGTSHWMDLMELLHSRLAHLFVQKHLVEEETACVCRLYSLFFRFLLSAFGAKDSEVYSYRAIGEKKDKSQSWRDVLLPFRKLGGESIHLDMAEQHTTHMPKSLDVTERDIELCTKLNAQCCYLLSNASLKIRVLACDCLTLGFQFLAFVGNNHEDPRGDEDEGQQSNIKNSILRQVADSWPSVKARLVNVSDEISAATKRGVSTVIITAPQPTIDSGQKKIDVATQRYFLAKTFTLVAYMCKCSGDFMAERFRNDAWPIAAQHLGEALQWEEPQSNHHSGSRRMLKEVQDNMQLKRIDAGRSLSEYVGKPGLTWGESERALVYAILECLKSAIGDEECGKALYRILSPVGSVLLPFLGIDDGKVTDLSMCVLFNILSIDCDIMLRSLLEVSGRGFPPPPLALRKKKQNEAANEVSLQPSIRPLGARDDIKALDRPSTTDYSWAGCISERCIECLGFLESLPEQPLL